MIAFIVKDLLPGLILILVAFWVGSQKSELWGLAGFLPLFVIGSIVILRGWDIRIKKKKPDQ